MSKNYRAEQLALQSKVFNEAKVDVVTCGDCGGAHFQDVSTNGPHEFECPYCGFTSEPCDFPDLITHGLIFKGDEE